MNNPGYILLTISLVIGLASLVLASRKNGFIFPYSYSFKKKYVIDKSKLEDYGRTMFLIATSSVVVGLFISQDIRMAFEFTAINMLFIGYALAWMKIVKLK